MASAFSSRPQGDVLCLFDVDDTLTPARRPVSAAMVEALAALRRKCAIGFVGGSDLRKIREQLEALGGDVMQMFDYCFAENGLTAYRSGEVLASQSFIGHLGEDRYKRLVNFVLRELADIDCPVKRGTFIEFRNGMINISPVGRNASVTERDTFESYDRRHRIRERLIEKLQAEFHDYSLTYAIGGQISFDVFPTGWNKTYALRHVESEGFREIHFFGDKTHKGGNDHEIFTDERTVGHTVTSPQETQRQLKELFAI